MNQHIDSGVSEAVEFLRQLRPDGPWNLAAVVPDVWGAEATVCRTLDEARSWLEARAGRKNLYYGPNVAPKPTGYAGRARKDDIDHVEFIHVDVDVDKATDDLPLAERKARKVEELMTCRRPGAPTFIIDSGGGLQALWRVEDLSQGDAERANLHLLRAFGGDTGTHDISRLLRLPGPPNIPDERKRARGRTVVSAKLVGADPRNRYIGLEVPLAAPPATAAPVTSIGPPEDVVDLAVLVTDERVLAIVRDGRLREAKEGDDSRSAWLFDGVCGLLRAGLTSEQVLGVITDPQWGISESVLERSSDAERYARHTVANALARFNAEHDFEDEVEVTGDAAQRSARPSRFKRLSIGDLMSLPSPKWLLEGMVPENALVQVYGRRKSNKTFVTLDMVLCVATGREFHGIGVERGR